MAGVTAIPGPANDMDAAWVRLFRSERRMREQAVPVVRAGTVRAALVTTSMWQRGGWESPENHLHGVSAAATASCVTALAAPVIVWTYPPQYGG